jgi:hypothetical protein
MLEMKIILVMTLRAFDIRADYAQWDIQLGRERPGDELGGKRVMFGEFFLFPSFPFLYTFSSLIYTHFPKNYPKSISIPYINNLPPGYRAYPQMKAAAKPADGMPARVTRRKTRTE